ncbi:hypothetical protein SANTM175S_03629 [Streptomyces antimycoticus]
MLSGTYRDGLHLSPLIARHVVSLMPGGPGLPDLAEFAPERDLISAWSREEVLEDVVRHTMATGYEFPWRLPLEWPHMMETFLRGPFAELADRLSDTYTPPADLMTAIYVLRAGGPGGAHPVLRKRVPGVALTRRPGR